MPFVSVWCSPTFSTSLRVAKLWKPGFKALDIPAKKAEFNVKWSFKVMFWGVSGKTWRPKALKIPCFRLLHCHLTHRLHRTPRECPHKPYIARNYCHYATSLPLIVSVYLHSNFRDGLRKRMYFETECEMAAIPKRRYSEDSPVV